MRAYVPVAWAELRGLQRDGVLPGPLRACAVDPAWRAGDPTAEDEQWEYVAQEEAAQALAEGAGVVLALDVDPDGELFDGWFVRTEPIRRASLAAVLTADLAWFGVQEIPALLAAHDDAGRDDDAGRPR